MKVSKKLLALLMAVLLLAAMTACGKNDESQPAAAQPAEGSTEAADAVEETASEEDEENYETGDASLDNTRNQDEIGADELLVVSFGTSYNDNRRLTIGAIEEHFEAAFPDWSVRRGFTSQIIIDHVARRDNVQIDNVTQALDRAADNGVERLVVQPTHLMNGLEYQDLAAELASYADAFQKVALGEPLLTSDEDFRIVAEAIVSATKEYDDGETAICFMGHGTEAESNAVYSKMQTVLRDMGCENYYIGTVEAAPTVEDVLAAVSEKEYSKVVLRPLMIVAGDHANNDMAGDEEDSWKSIFTAAGYEVTCVVEGLGQLEEIRQLFADHAAAAIAQVAESDQVASADEMAEPENVVEEGMVPVTADQLKDGTYSVTVDSSSSMFNIVDCQLTVSEGQMTAVMTMGGTGYLHLYMGTGEEAVAADESCYIPFAETETGEHTFTVPVEALDAGIDCSAFSKKKEKWYDRVLVFRADSLPLEAYAEEVVVSADSLALADGSYTCAVTLEGGSGRASVESPCVLTVANGQITAELVWSSSNYDYMKVDGLRYDMVNTEGNSTFCIPVAGFDFPLPVIADTVAMSEPHEIEYTLCFDSASLQSAE